MTVAFSKNKLASGNLPYTFHNSVDGKAYQNIAWKKCQSYLDGLYYCNIGVINIFFRRKGVVLFVFREKVTLATHSFLFLGRGIIPPGVSAKAYCLGSIWFSYIL